MVRLDTGCGSWHAVGMEHCYWAYADHCQRSKIKKILIVSCLVTFLAFFSACNGREAITIDATQPPVVTSTPGSEETPRPTSTPMPPPLPPSPTPLSPEMILANAAAEMRSVRSYTFDWLIEFTGVEDGGELTSTGVSFRGDYQAPGSFHGTTNSCGLDGIEIISIEDRVYLTDPATGNWRQSSWAELEECDFILSRAHPRGVISDIEYVGQEVLDGQPVHHIQGRLPAGQSTDNGDGNVEEGWEAYWIGVDDNRFYLVKSEFEESGAEGDRVKIKVTKRFSDFNKPLVIVAPLVPPVIFRHSSPLLGISYQKPEDWESERWGEVDCDSTNCRGERIEKVDADGTATAVSIAALAAAEVDALLEKMLGSAEIEIGEQESFWRADENGLEGILLLDDGALHVRGLWVERPEDETAVRLIVESILPFEKYELPGLLSMVVPPELKIIRGGVLDQIAFSTRDVGPDNFDESQMWIEEGDAAILLHDEGSTGLSAYEQLGHRLDELGDEIVMIEQRRVTVVNGQQAASARFRSDASHSAPEQTITYIEGPDRNVAVITVTHAETADEFQPLFDVALNSLRISSKPPAPRLIDPAQIPGDYKPNQALGYGLQIPPDWRANKGFGLGTFVPPGVPALAPDLYADNLMITRAVTTSGVSDLAIEELLREAWVRESWVKQNVYMVSDEATAEFGDQQFAAVMVADADYGGSPSQGILAVVRRGDVVLYVSAWGLDFEAHQEAIENIISSITIPPQ